MQGSKFGIAAIGAMIGLWSGAQLAAPQILFATSLTEVQQRGYLIVAVKDNWRPLGFRTEAGELEGLEIDIAHQLAEELLGTRNAVVFRPVANTDRLSTLLDGEVDLVIAGLAANPSRSRLVEFSTPYYFDGTALITRRTDVQSLSDAAKQPIAVLNNSSTIATVRALLPDANLIGVESYQQALEMLEAGQAATFAGDASVLTGWVQDHPDYRLLPTLLSAEALAVAMPKGGQSAGLRNQVNAAIEQWYAEEWLQDRIDHWGLPQ